MEARSDETLLRLYAHHRDESAFRELARRYGALVYGACLHHLHRPELAEDAAQGVFLVLARKAGRVRIKTSLVPWLYATAKLECRSLLRAERRKSNRERPLDETIAAPDDSTDEALFEALDALSGAEREVIVLRFVQGLSLAEVGKAQGISEDAARMRVQRALGRLRREYVPTVAAPLPFLERLASLSLPQPSPLMNAPTLLATGSLATLTLVGASALAMRSPSTRPPAIAATPEVQTPKTSVRITPSELPKDEIPRSTTGKAPPMLDTAPFMYAGPLTLEATVVERDLWSDEQMAAYVARRKKALRKIYPEGEQLDSIIASLENLARNRVRTKTYPVILETDGRRIRYQYSVEGLESELVTFYDGSVSRQVQNGGSLVLVSKGLNAEFLWRLPLMGQGYPFRPIVTPYKISGKERWPRDWAKGYALCNAASQLRTNPHEDFNHQTAIAQVETIEGQPVLKHIIHGIKGRAKEDWEFSDFVPVNGHMFARQMKWNGYDQDETGKILSQRYEKVFTITRLDTNVPPDRFDYRALLKDDATFMDAVTLKVIKER